MARRVGLAGTRWASTLALVLAGLVVGAGRARAQDAPVPPKFVTVGFQDMPDGRDCDEAAARAGRCIEEVQFEDVGDLFSTHTDPDQVQRYKTYGRLYEWVWEDLARRWKGDGVVDNTLTADGVSRLPSAADLWDASGRSTGAQDEASKKDTTRVFALPAQDKWVDATDWVGGSPSHPPIYRSLAYSQPAGLVKPPPAVLLEGRFARRLVYDGRSHQFDIMDGDPESSGPFFEQMYPYEQALQSQATQEGDDQSGQGDQEVDEYTSGSDSWWGAGQYFGGADAGSAQPAPAPPTDGAALQDDGFGFAEFGAYHYDSLDDDKKGPAVNANTIPLSDFAADESIKTPPRGGWSTDAQKKELVEARRRTYRATLLPLQAGIDGLRTKAHGEFDNFYDTVGTQIVRFAREEYTPTHLRVLTALMAMHDPPGTSSEARGLTKEAVAASVGQLDSDDALKAEAGAAFVPGRNFSVNYKALPKPVVQSNLSTMELWNHPDRKLLIAFTREIGAEFKQLLRPRVQPITGFDDDTLKKWAEDNAKDSHRAAFILKYMKPIALEVIVQRIGREEGKTERDRIETELILDHVRDEYVSRFSGDPAVRQTPGDLEKMAADQWVGVLQAHGFYANKIPDGPGAVDPLAICTTKNGQDALKEPVFGVINIDGLVVAPDGLQDPDKVLWHARDQLPFLLIDDPNANKPKITRIVSLPGERAVYRVRWKVWSGWHLLWAPEPVSVPDQQYRLALRTAALCDDMVVTSPRLVPTIVRAALLDGNFRPVNTIQGDGKEAVEAFRAKPTNQAMFDSSNDVVGQGKQAVKVAKDLKSGQNPVASAGEALALGKKLLGGKQVPDPVPPIPAASVKYLRDLVAGPLRKQVGGKPGVVVVMDESQVRDKQRVHFPKPRAPYVMARSKEGDGFRYTAAWAYYLPPDTADDPTREMLVPAYQPTQSVSSNTMVQKWTRRQTGDWALSAGLGGFPIRRVQSSCTKSVASDSTVLDCSQIVNGSTTGQTSVAHTGGMTIDASALRTLWRSSYQRYAVEFGPEVHIDVVPRGQSAYDTATGSATVTTPSTGLRYTWVINYMGGVVVGVRLGMPPRPLAVKGDRYPWGADRADGSSTLGRVEYGLRLGALFGPSFSGFTATGFGELWAGWSLRRKRARNASFTPFHPDLLLGPYVRGSYTPAPFATGTTRLFSVDNVTALYVGVRFHVRLNGSAAGSLPEAK